MFMDNTGGHKSGGAHITSYPDVYVLEETPKCSGEASDTNVDALADKMSAMQVELVPSGDGDQVSVSTDSAAAHN